MTPLQITCEVVTPIVGWHLRLPLDGPLAYGAYCELTDAEQADLPDISTCEFPRDFDLPLRRWTCPAPDDVRDERLLDDDGLLWGWCCSEVVTEWQGRQVTHVRRPAPTNAMRRHTDAAVVNSSSGKFKPLNRKYEARWPVGGLLTWYAIGDAQRAAELLAHVPNLGKLHNHGHGKVACQLDGTPIWCVEEHDDDDAWRRHRRMPATHRSGVAKLGPVRAPHWHRSRWAPLVEPDGGSISPDP